MKEVAIKDICKKDSSSLKQKELMTEGKYPVYGASGIAGYLDSYHQDNAYIGIVKDGSGIGRVAFYPEKSSLIGTMQYILPRAGYDIRYIGYCLQSLDLSKYKQGAAIPHIYFRDYGERLVKVTDDLDEQQRIVERLDAAFENIDKLKANAEKQLAEAQTLFQKSLAKAMEPKEGWEERNLDDVAAIFSGYAFKSSVFQKEGKYQVLRIGNIKQNNLRLSDNAVFIDDLDSGVLNKSLLKEGDLVVTQTGTRHKRDYGFVAMVEKDNLLLNQRNACVRFRNKLSAQFFLYYSYTDLYKDSFFANEGGTVGQGNVGLSALKEMKYYTPPLAEQQRIVERLDALSENIRKYEEIQRQIISECDALKQALLRKVFE